MLARYLVLQRATTKAFVALLDNYERGCGIAEKVTRQEKQEEVQFLALIMQKPRRIDHQTKLAPIGGKRCRTCKTVFVQKVDPWRCAATERDCMLKLFGGLDGFDQGPSNATARAENDRHAGLGK